MKTSRKRGFTLVELAITVAILFIVVAAATPLFGSIIAQRRLTGALEQVAADLRHAQSLAVTQGIVHRLHSGADGTVSLPGQYRLERDNGAGGWVQVNAWYNISGEYNGSSLQSLTDNAGTNVATFDVRFNSQGAVANTGVASYPIRLTIVAQNGTTRRVEVLRTGVVRIPTP